MSSKTELIIRRTKTGVANCWRNSRKLIASYSIFITLCLVTYAAETLDPEVKLGLSLSSGRYYGIVTSIFVHSSWAHVSSNMYILAWLAVVLVLLQNMNSYKSARCIHHLFFWMPFVSAILANSFFVYLAPRLIAEGASGFDYAVIAVVVFSSLFGINGTMQRVGVREYFQSAKHWFVLAVSLLFAVPFLALIMYEPRLFLNVAPGVNSFVHGLSFAIAMILTVGYFAYEREHSASRKTNTAQEQATV